MKIIGLMKKESKLFETLIKQIIGKTQPKNIRLCREKKCPMETWF